MFAEELNLAQHCMLVDVTCVDRTANTVAVSVDVWVLAGPSANQAPVDI